MFAATKFVLVIMGGLASTNPSPAIDASLRFNNLESCLAAKAVLEAETMPILPRERVSLYVEFHCISDVS